MNCPVDNTLLQMTERQGIEIDYCPTCRGVWLDRGELDKLIDRAAAIAPAGRLERDDEERHRARPQDRFPTPFRDDDDDDHRARPGDRGPFPPSGSAEYRPTRPKRRGLLGELFDFD